MVGLAAVSSTLLAVVVASPRVGQAFVPAPPGLSAHGFWGHAPAAAASTGASTPMPVGGFFGLATAGRRRGATTMMSPPAAQAIKVGARPSVLIAFGFSHVLPVLARLPTPPLQESIDLAPLI